MNESRAHGGFRFEEEARGDKRERRPTSTTHANECIRCGEATTNITRPRQGSAADCKNAENPESRRTVLDLGPKCDARHGTWDMDLGTLAGLGRKSLLSEERKTAGEPGAGVAGHFSSNQPTSRSSQAMRALDWKDKGTGGRRASDYGCVIGTNGGPPRVEWVGERAWFVRGFELAWQVWQFVLGSSFPGPGRWLMARRRGTLNIEASRTDDYMRLCTYVPFSVAHCPFYSFWYVYTDLYVETANSSPSLSGGGRWEGPEIGSSRALYLRFAYMYMYIGACTESQSKHEVASYLMEQAIT